MTQRADDAGRRPGGQQSPVDRADKLRSENIGEIGRNGGEAAAIHRQDDAERGDEQRLRAHMRERRRERVEHDAETEEDEIGRLAAEPIRQRGPEKTPAILNSENKPTKPGRRSSRWRVLRDRRSSAEKPTSGSPNNAPPKISWNIGEAIAEHADAGRNVEAQHHPDQPELRRLMRVVEMRHRPGRSSHFCVAGAVQPSGRQPAGATR